MSEVVLWILMGYNFLMRVSCLKFVEYYEYLDDKKEDFLFREVIFLFKFKLFKWNLLYLLRNFLKYLFKLFGLLVLENMLIMKGFFWFVYINLFNKG